MSTAALVQAPRCAAAFRPAARPTRAARAPVMAMQQSGARRAGTMATKLLGTAAAAAVLLAGGPALAREKVAEFPTSGLIFRDTVKIIELKDDKVDGVVIYLTDYQRSITERLAKAGAGLKGQQLVIDPFGDPSQASLTCLANRPVTVADEAAITGVEGKEIFSERKGINLFQNKNLRVRRIYDDKNKVIIYVAYSTRFTGAAEEKEMSTSRYRTSVCAVPVSAPSLVTVGTEVAAAPETQG